jgi:xanthine dehydrogenase accessory factor
VHGAGHLRLGASLARRYVGRHARWDELPALYIAGGACHERTAVVALTHDPRMDDLTVIEAVRTPAFYIAVMGSRRTSEKRMERLRRVGGLGPTEFGRVHAPSAWRWAVGRQRK